MQESFRDEGCRKVDEDAEPVGGFSSSKYADPEADGVNPVCKTICGI